MYSLERMQRLGQIKGMAYEPTPSDVIQRDLAPNCHDPNDFKCRDFDMDYFNSDFANLWGQAGRDDLGNIRNLAVNLMRLYNWTGNDGGGAPLRSHMPYLDYCRRLGLGTMVPFSNYNATIPPASAQNTATSIVREITNSGALHPAVKMWQVTNEFELTSTIKAQDVARLVEYIVRAEEAAGITADGNKVPIVVSVSTAAMFGVPVQSMGQIAALRLAFTTDGGTLPNGTFVQGNKYLAGRDVWLTRFVIGVQSFQWTGEVEGFVKAMWQKYEGEIPILLTEHGFNSVEAARTGPPLPGNKQAFDDANQARIVAKQIADANSLCKQYTIFRGMCYFQWLNTYYKCGENGIYSNKCTEANFGMVKWNEFGAALPKPNSFAKTGKGQPYPVDAAIQKSQVYQAVSKGFSLT